MSTDIERKPRSSKEPSCIQPSFKGTIHPFLITLAVFGLYFWELRDKTSVRKCLHILHRMYCFGLVFLLWGHMITTANDSFNMAHLQLGFVQKYASVLSFLFLCVNAIILLWIAGTQKVDKFILAYDNIGEACQTASFQRAKWTALLVALCGELMILITHVTIYLNSDSASIVSNATSDTINYEGSTGKVAFTFFITLQSHTVFILPSVFHCFMCYVLVKKFTSFSLHFKETLNSSILDVNGLKIFRMDHSKLCHAVFAADDIFAPFLLVQFVGGTTSICITLYFVIVFGGNVVLFMEITVISVYLMAVAYFSGKLNHQVRYAHCFWFFELCYDRFDHGWRQEEYDSIKLVMVDNGARPVARIDLGGAEPPNSGSFGPQKWTFWTSPP